MATTTNYGWTTPDDTALVKDGAAAIRTLGSSVDTTVKALSPGTTAGDVDYYTAATTKTRLGIGSTGQVLTVAAGVPSWATISAGGITSIATGTLSGTTTTISSISGSYKNLYLQIVGPLIGTGSPLTYTVNGDTGSQYYQLRAGLESATWLAGTVDTKISPNAQNVLTTSNSRTYTLFIQNYAITGYKFMTSFYAPENASGTICFANYKGSSSAITSIGISTVAGTSSFTAGTYTLFGVN
jgi:hypothetical protein